MSEVIQISFSWFILLSIIHCSSNHVVINGKISSPLSTVEWQTTVYMYTTSSLSTHLLLGTWTVSILFINTASMNIAMHISFWISIFIFLGQLDRSGIVESYDGRPSLIFWETSTPLCFLQGLDSSTFFLNNFQSPKNCLNLPNCYLSNLKSNAKIIYKESKLCVSTFD